MYSLFREVHPNETISITAFAQLRPSYCKFPGKKGHHVSCTCLTHENFKLLLTAINVNLSVSQALSAITCNTDEESCCFGICSSCPKTNILTEWVNSIAYDDITYNFWGSMEGYYGTNLFEKSENREQFFDRLKNYLPEILPHHYIMQKQYEYIDYLKRDVLPLENSAIIHVDFAQNYTYVMQRAVQGYHWCNNQASVHPFVISWFDSTIKSLKTKSYVVCSDHLIHDADTFYAFRHAFIKKIKSEGLSFEKFYYISNGAGSQYKNKKNFANLLLHKSDYGIAAECHFFPTSHGKSSCDGIGAVVKKVCTSGSLKIDPITKTQIYIRSAEDMVKYAGKQLNGDKVHVMYVSSAEVTSLTQDSIFQKRYESLRAIAGTRIYHSFIPVGQLSLDVRRYSLATSFKNVSLHIHNKKENFRFTVDDFVGVKVGRKYTLGKVVSIEDSCYAVQLLVRKRRCNQFMFPETSTIQTFADEEIIMQIKHIEFDSDVYKLGSADFKALEASTKV